MTLEKIKDIAKEARIDDNEESLTFKASVILLYGILNNTCSVNKLKKGTGYWWKEVYFIVHNFWAAGIIQAYQYDVDFSDSEIISLTVHAMVGAGELVRAMEGFNPTEKRLSWEEYEERTKYCRGTYTARQRCLMPIEQIKELNRRREENDCMFYMKMKKQSARKLEERKSFKPKKTPKTATAKTVRPRKVKEKLSINWKAIATYASRGHVSKVEEELETKQFVRPEAKYTNSKSPFGISDELHNGKY